MKKRIGFIAMSGIRALDQELLELGLTLPGFVERSKVIASLPSLGALTLAALTPESDFDVEYHEISDIKTALPLPAHFDLVALTSLSAQVLEAYAVADQYRAMGIPVVMGGLHVTAMPDEAAQHATSVVIGEGEPVWPDVLADFLRGELKSRYSAVGNEFQLSDAPIPRFDLLDPDKYNRITVQTARGCPHKCEFCASSILLTPKYKIKPPGRVIDEIRAIKAIWDRPFIEFADDNSLLHRRDGKDLLRRLIPEEIRWFTETDIAIGEDLEMLDLMRESGCQQVLVGLETPRADSLEGIDIGSKWKARMSSRYMELIERIQSRGITVNGCFILGLDDHTPDTFDDVFDYIKRSGLYEAQVTLLTPFPGTPLYRRLLKEGRILKDGAWDRCTLFDINYQPRNMSVDELRTGFHNLVRRLYSEEETQRRRRGFRERYREHLRSGASSTVKPEFAVAV